jgi:tetratricopeptide (TPR) repeat protein
MVRFALALLAWLAQPATAHAQSLDPEQRVPAPAGAAAAVSTEGWSRRLARNHLERALALERRDDLTGALREYTQCIAIDSTLGDAYLRLGALRERMGDAREAELVYSEAVRLADARAAALVQRSHLHRAAGRNAQALSDLEAAVELDANRDALSELARDYVEAHAWAAALAAARRLASSALESGDQAGVEQARLEVRALRVLAAETEPTLERVSRHNWAGRALAHIAQR